MESRKSSIGTALVTGPLHGTSRRDPGYEAMTSRPARQLSEHFRQLPGNFPTGDWGEVGSDRAGNGASEDDNRFGQRLLNMAHAHFQKISGQWLFKTAHARRNFKRGNGGELRRHRFSFNKLF